MKEFIDKLIEKLEGVKSIVNSPADIVWNNAVKMCIYKANELAEEYKDKAMSNADKIRSMTNKEMSTDLVYIFEELFEDGVPSPEWMEKWLQSEAE